MKNHSKYGVNKVSFRVFGSVQGRSTKYDLSPSYSYFVSDAILGAWESKKGCFLLNQENWPKGESLIITGEITEVEFKVKDGIETVY